MMDPSWRDWFAARRAEAEERGLTRRLRPLAHRDGLHAELDGRRVVLFSSNDYLGLSSHPRVREAVAEATESRGMGPRGAALVCGYTREHEALEASLAALAGKETALLFPTGYAANLSVLTALTGPGAAVFSDERNHASIIDGCRLARERGAAVSVYRHADPEHLEVLLSSSDAKRWLVVTDAVFSMDGDVAPLREIVEVAGRTGALLAVDEAHAMLVFGESGGGVSEALGVREGVHVVVGTLGKAAGAHGGFVAADESVRERLLNAGRAYVYSTALPVPVAAAARAAIEVARAEPSIRGRLWRHVRALAGALGSEPRSPIFPVLMGGEDLALDAARLLLERGLYVPAIRPPTVPEGSSRLRITLSAAHSDGELEALIEALREIGG